MNASRRVAVALSMVAAGAFAENLYPNPDFNDVDGTTGWSTTTGTFQHLAEDASGCPASGSLGAFTAELSPNVHILSARGPCVSNVGTTLVDLSLRYRASFGPGDVALISVVRYAAPDCAGDPSGGFDNPVASSTEWQFLEGPLSVGASDSFRVLVEASGPFPASVEIDEIRVTDGEVTGETPTGYRRHMFLDDFDGGGICRWTFGIVDDNFAPPGRGVTRMSGAASLPRPPSGDPSPSPSDGGGR